jgi:transposase InsO family protein
VLFERVCREHGITAQADRPVLPDHDGKVEWWHRTLRRELLDTADPFADLPSAQAAISGWVHAYDHARPAPGARHSPAQSEPVHTRAPRAAPRDRPGKQTDITSETGHQHNQ